ncbi:hypothetical protein BCR35DRAFT_308102 [Leucosporidium creatinivorum]|uniref:Uncharacterized protein n=1 Tax=Leucosporidium creatinivorum TaxID=106004 RepID=A0A1Y2ECI5_9BASI|nr:hypothetical protein BCR35DRAFT_308102 [Leucosporidium creatinivorum]
MSQHDTTMGFPADEDDSFAYEDEPDLQEGVRNLSVSSDGTIDSLVSQDETPTPPQSPNPRVHVTPPSNYHSLQDEPADLPPPVAEIAAPIHPGLARQNTSPESGLAARRAASGKLPNKALLSLQQMRFETSNSATGLGVGPGSAGFEGMEGISPGFQTAAGMNLRLALGLGHDDKEGSKDAGSSRPTTPTGENSPSMLGSPSLLRSPSNRRRSPLPRSPGASFVTDPFASPEVKIPPSLRGSKILDKLNLSPSTLNSPLSPTPERPSPYPAPPSPLIRTSAFTYSNTGPLTPLTPSHVPGAPTLGGGSSFDWFSYSMPDSPGCPTPPTSVKGAYTSDNLSPTKQAFFLPTPSPSGDRQRHPLPASPLGAGRFASGSTNPFFSP